MSVSKRVRFEVLRRDQHTCQYCGGIAPDYVLTVDHVVPVALGGSDDPGNLVAACKDCNAGTARDVHDARCAAHDIGLRAGFDRGLEIAHETHEASRHPGERALIAHIDGSAVSHVA